MLLVVVFMYIAYVHWFQVAPPGTHNTLLVMNNSKDRECESVQTHLYETWPAVITCVTLVFRRLVVAHQYYVTQPVAGTYRHSFARGSEAE